MTMTSGLGRIARDPTADVRTRRMLDALSTPTRLVTDLGVTINDAGLIALRLVAGSGLTQSAAGLTLNNTLYSSVIQLGNTAATETVLFTYSIPGATLTATGDSLEFASCGTIAATAAVDKQIKVKFGATTLFDTGALAVTVAAAWTLRGSVTRSGVTTQKCEAVITVTSLSLASTVTYAEYATAAETLSGAVVLQLTGKGTNANDVVGERFKVVKQAG